MVQRADADVIREIRKFTAELGFVDWPALLNNVEAKFPGLFWNQFDRCQACAFQNGSVREASADHHYRLARSAAEVWADSLVSLLRRLRIRQRHADGLHVHATQFLGDETQSVR
jgi:hypothetical protein